MTAQQNNRQIRIILADDQELFSENMKIMLENLSSDLAVIGIAANGREAVDMALEHEPDIVLMDVIMPVLDGVEAARELHKKAPKIKIVMLTTFPDDSYVQDALHYGAYGYILKNINPEDLIASIHAIARGQALFSPAILEKMAALIDGGSNESAGEYHTVISQLNRREKEIVNLMAKRCSNKEIAEKLYLAEPTIRNYVSAIYAKIGVKDRVQVMHMVRGEKIEPV